MSVIIGLVLALIVAVSPDGWQHLAPGMDCRIITSTKISKYERFQSDYLCL